MFILFPYCFHIVSILFPYHFHSVSIVFPCYFHVMPILFPQHFHIFLENMKTIWNEFGKDMEGIWISWLPERGKMAEKIWNRCGKYGVQREIMEYILKQKEYIRILPKRSDALAPLGSR